MSCQICTLPFTLKLRVKTVCIHCKFECCKKCLLTYVKSSNKNISCMNCKEETDESELSKFMSKLSISKLQNTVLKEYVYNEEKKLLPFTEKQMIISNKKLELTNTMNSLVKELGESIKDIYVKKINNISLDNFNICIGSCKKYIYRDSDEMFHNCLDCELCWCYKCGMQCDPLSHICDVNILSSVKSIEEETKPCPTCGIKIYKIDGCSQIMCSECNTFFDFNTGLKDKDSETKHARNYMELLDEFEMKVVSEEVYNDFNDKIKVCSNYDLWNSPVYNEFTHASQFIRRFVAIVINSKVFIKKNLISKVNTKKYNEKYRKDFIKGIISEKDFKKYSLKNYKEYKNRLYVMKVLTYFEFCVQSIIHKHVQIFNTLRNNKTNIPEKKAKLMRMNLKSELIEFLKKNKDIIESKEFNEGDEKSYLQYMETIKIFSFDRSSSLNIIDLCNSNISINF